MRYKPEVTEVCQNCERENTFVWDTDADGYKTYCPKCGEELMLCDACMHADDNDEHYCDWQKGNGCWRSRKKYKLQNPSGEPHVIRARDFSPEEWKAILKIWKLPENTEYITLRWNALEYIINDRGTGK